MRSFRAQYSIRFLMAALFLVAVGAAVLTWRIRKAERRERAVRALILVSEAKMILATPILVADSAGVLGVSPSRAAELCTQAMDIDPSCKDAYITRAAAYDILGETSLAQQDRDAASRLEEPEQP